MSNVMQYTETSEVLGIPITLKMLMQSENEFTIIAIKDDGEFHKLFTYMADIDALEADKAEVSKIADDYARQVNKTLKAVIVVSDGVVWFVTNVMDLISSMFGGLAGFGLIGIVMFFLSPILFISFYYFELIQVLMISLFHLLYLNLKISLELQSVKIRFYRIHKSMTNNIL